MVTTIKKNKYFTCFNPTISDIFLKKRLVYWWTVQNFIFVLQIQMQSIYLKKRIVLMGPGYVIPSLTVYF